VSRIFRANHNELPWFEYENAIRVKALTRSAEGDGVPPVQYIEYAAGHVDPLHSHDTDEFFIVVDGELWLDDDSENRPGSVIFIPRHTQYAARAGANGAGFYRLVV
jgi:quercetin dioxygenase-like cupin family protein